MIICVSFLGKDIYKDDKVIKKFGDSALAHDIKL